jgi:hypothetical protein
MKQHGTFSKIYDSWTLLIYDFTACCLWMCREYTDKEMICYCSEVRSNFDGALHSFFSSKQLEYHDRLMEQGLVPIIRIGVFGPGSGAEFFSKRNLKRKSTDY